MTKKHKNILGLIRNERGESSGGGWLFFFIFMLVASYTTYSEPEGSNSYDYKPSPSYSSYDPSEDLKVVTYKQTSDQYFKYIEGFIQNNSNHNFAYAQVDVSLYDSNGYVVETTFDNINNLAPGEIWHFKAMIIDGSRASGFKIKNVSGF